MVFQWIGIRSQGIFTSLSQTLASIIRQETPKPKPSIQNILGHYSQKPTQYLLYKALDVSEGYLEQDEVKKDIAAGTSTEAEIRANFEDLYNGYPTIDKWRHVQLHYDHLHEICDLLSASNIMNDDLMDHQEFIRRHCEIMQRYASKVARLIWNLNSTDFTGAPFMPGSLIWTHDQTSEYRQPITYGPNQKLLSDHQKILNIVLDWLKSAYVTDDNAAYILSQTLGNAGYYFMTDHGFPLFINTFPYSWLESRRDEIWRTRNGVVPGSDSEVKSPTQDPDRDHEYLDKKVADRVKNFDFVKIQNDFVKRMMDQHTKTTGSPAEEDTDKGESSSSQKPPKQGDNKDSKQQGDSSSGGAPAPPPPGGSNVPAIPDDDQYVPNGLLASKVRHYTKVVQSKPANELFHDHMERFNVTNESAIPIARSQVKTGLGADFQFTTNIRGNIKLYVVTYTRKSRKPIFNPVN